jgi:hypothetical protein
MGRERRFCRWRKGSVLKGVHERVPGKKSHPLKKRTPDFAFTPLSNLTGGMTDTATRPPDRREKQRFRCTRLRPGARKTTT